MNDRLLTILLPQYRTPQLTRLCLRSLKMHTDLNKVKVIVIDNASGDESAEYLRSLDWITLLERPVRPDEDPAAMHADALDLGMTQVETPFVLSMHTDTIITSDDWLDFLLEKINASEQIAGVGSWKLEHKSALKLHGKKLEQFLREKILRKRPDRHIDHHYLRSHCALYRTELVRKFTSGFHDGDTAGKVMHRKLLEQGFEMLFMSSEELGRFMKHLNHATMILNPEIAGRKTSRASARRRIRRELKSVKYDRIVNDSSLD